MDILEDILQAYLDRLTTEAGTGGEMTWLKSWFSVRNPSIIPPSFNAKLPLILVYPSGEILVEPDCLGSPYSGGNGVWRDKKTYSITMTLLIETLKRDNAAFFWHSGTSYTSEITSKIRTIETVFGREDFDLSAACHTTRMSYQSIALPTYQGREIDQGHIGFEHIYQDRQV